MELKFFHVKDPMYKQTIRFCYGGKPKDLLAKIVEVDGELEEDPGEFGSGIVIENRPDQTKAPNFWIWVKAFSGTPKAYGFLAHECTHLFQSIINWLEIEVNDSTTEPCAALFENLFEELLMCIREAKRRPHDPSLGKGLDRHQ
uniref:Uncharacterized protein n=1 Tax=viral metagenome TaxID=1070528 RepID=A0A6M3II25_9ZZZZ